MGAPAGPGNPTSTQADFNHDGIPDAATILYGPRPASRSSLGNADGSSRPSQNLAVGSNPISIASGDFDGDGWADLVVVNSLSGGKTTFSVLLNDRTW